MVKIDKIYCDFDGTITKQDSVNVFFEQFADSSWTHFEELWVQGKITSRENAVKQVSLIREIPQKTLDDYINSIEIDDYFLDFYEYITKNNIKLTVLSDGFDLFIKEVFKKYDIKNVEFYANHLIYENNKFRIEFPYHNKNCNKGAGMCKCQKVTEEEFCYIGDGISDLCIAKKANTLFATKRLKDYCNNNKIPCYPFNSFKDIIKNLDHLNS